jgi:hypothetical protein
MGLALGSMAGYVTNASTTLNAWTNATGDSNTIKSFREGTPAYLLSGWGLGATLGYQQVFSPRMHDTSRGIRYKLIAAVSVPPWQMGLKQLIYPQDVLTIQQSGGGSEVDSGCYLQWYQDLPGVNARLVDWQQWQNRIEDIVTVETTHTQGTAGDWSGAVALNSGSQLLKANRDYMLLGYASDTNITSVGLHGPDTGNLRVCGPGTTDRKVTASWYMDLSRLCMVPCNAIINAANVGATFVDVQGNTGSGTNIIEHTFALLAA